VVADGAGTAAAAIRTAAGNLVPLVLPVGRLAEDAAGLPGEPGRLPAFPTAGSADIGSNRAAQPFHVVEVWLPISPTLLRRGMAYLDAQRICSANDSPTGGAMQ
jgi:hypothetical protein